MKKYYVFHADRGYVRTVDAYSSFDARKMLAVETAGDTLDYYAVRHDLMTDNEHKKVADAGGEK